MPSFIDFLKTGRIGELTLNKTQADVKSILGDPTDVSVRKHPEIWKYGPIELAFYRRSKKEPLLLTSIKCRFDDNSMALDSTIWGDGWVPTHGMDSHTFFEEVNKQNVHFLKMHGRDSQLEQFELHLELDSSINVDFLDDKLCSVRIESEEPSELRQMSITVSENDFRLINREAKLLGISSAALCTQWVAKQVEFLKAAEMVYNLPSTNP